MADDDYEVHASGAGASETYPEQCSKLRKNGHVMIKGRPCKIVEMSTSKTGKHGHAKVHFVGLDIFTGKKLEDICPSTHSMDVPHVQRYELEILTVDADGFVQAMDEGGDIREDLKIPESIGIPKTEEMLKIGAEKEDPVQCIVWKACGQETILDLKYGKKQK